MSTVKESVWDYPRPPRLEVTNRHVEVIFNGVTIAESQHPIRILETSHPPVYYIPPADVKIADYLRLVARHTFCEFKGTASYYTIQVGDQIAEAAAWFYPNPVAAYAGLKDYVAFYPSRVEACFVDGERVAAQGGDFYGGWITSEIVGPFKGDPSRDTRGW